MVRQNNNNEIDLLELFFEILEHWKLILVAAILAGAIANAYSRYSIIPQYTSTAQLYVLNKTSDITSLTDINLGSKLMEDYLVIVKITPVLEKVIENLELNMGVEALSSKIQVSNPEDSRILKIVVTDSDPARAKEICQEVADVASEFIADKMDQSPPSIIQYGYTRSISIEPTIRSNTIKAAMLVACVIIAIIVIINLLNDTIRDADDVERKLGLNLLGTYPLDEAEEVTNTKKRKNRKKA